MPYFISPFAYPYMQVPPQIQTSNPKSLTELLHTQDIGKAAKIQKDFHQMSVKIDKMISKDFDLIEENVKNEQIRLALRNQTKLKNSIFNENVMSGFDNLSEDFTDVSGSDEANSDDASDLDALSPEAR